MSNKSPQNDRPEMFEDIDEFTNFTREYFSTDFPNELREGCPSPVEIKRLIVEFSTPPQSLRHHLFKCSPCFQLYREMLAARQDRIKPGTSIWPALVASFRRPIVGPVALALVLVSASVAMVLYLRNQSGLIAVSSDNVQSGNSSAEVSRTQQPSTVAAPGANTAVHIDFDDYHFRRGDKDGQIQGAQVSATQTHFLITLPDGSPSGKYTVAIEGAHGGTLKSIYAYSPDGKSMTADIDLSKLPRMRHWLCVYRATTEAPNCYPIVVH